jgi:uncharacterized repeat protein (TIGR03803 family)
MRTPGGACLRKLSWTNRTHGLLLLCLTMAIPSQSQTFTTLHSFDVTDGFEPYAGLVQTTSGLLYGTTYGGGANNGGSVFKISPTGTLTTIYSFCTQGGCPDGLGPRTGLVQATSGNIYGTTNNGGTSDLGTVFKITSGGSLKTLYSFCSLSNCADGAYPQGIVQATDGNLYGTTGQGGGASSDGTIFKITPGGTLTTLHSFDGTDGALPQAGLIQATDGNFYGTTSSGGTNGGGTVFKITPSGTLTTLYNFCSQSDCTDGEAPYAALVQGLDGNFYGTALGGGVVRSNAGTVFKITPSGALTTLYAFCAGALCTDGESPEAGLIQATDGNFYGVTYNGGGEFGGTIFSITASGALTTLYAFCSQSGCTDGANPSGTLVQDTNGEFYGTTYQGGNSTCTSGCGTVFSLSMGLGRFVETQTASGKVGAAVKILGTNLTGAMSVTFNGTAAAFTVVSSSEITTTVPVGARTGTVDVTVPSGTLKSNKKFSVTP